MFAVALLGRRLSLLAVRAVPLRTRPSTPTLTALKFASANADGARFLSGESRKTDSDNVSNSQHEEWVKFQQSISVDGFDTGQVTTVSTQKKSRGGKLARKKRERELALKGAATENERMLADIGGGQFPSLRYSDEETERLLAQAYANLPPRAGKRGTRNYKRQKVRWHLVRKIHRKQKKYRIRAHFRRMADRSRIKREVMVVKNTAKDICRREKDYHDYVMKRWAENVVADDTEVGKIFEKDG